MFPNSTAGWILWIIGWLFLGMFCLYKQINADRDDDNPFGDHSPGEQIFYVSIIIVFAPIWTLAAIIRQVIIEPWS